MSIKHEQPSDLGVVYSLHKTPFTPYQNVPCFSVARSLCRDGSLRFPLSSTLLGNGIHSSWIMRLWSSPMYEGSGYPLRPFPRLNRVFAAAQLPVLETTRKSSAGASRSTPQFHEWYHSVDENMKFIGGHGPIYGMLINVWWDLCIKKLGYVFHIFKTTHRLCNIPMESSPHIPDLRIKNGDFR